MEEKVTEISFSKIKMLKCTAYLLVLLGLSVYLLLDSRSKDDFMYYFGQAFGFLGLLFMGPLSLICIVLLLRRNTGLVFSSEGFKDHSVFGIGKAVLWSDVENIERVVVHGQKYLKVQLKDPQAFVEDLSGITRFMYMLNYRWYGTPVFLSSLLINASIDGLYDQVQLHWSASQWHRSQDQPNAAMAAE